MQGSGAVNNEEKILAMLENMQGDIQSLKQGQAKLEQGQAKLEQRQAELGQGQVDLRAEMNRRFDDLEFGLNEVLSDVGKVEDRIRQHEREFHSLGIK